MPKTTNQSKPVLKPPFSEDVMRLALSRLASVAEHLQGNADDDDPVAILSGVIDEDLALRGHIERRRNFDQIWLQETARR